LLLRFTKSINHIAPALINLDLAKSPSTSPGAKRLAVRRPSAALLSPATS
jgi:hypothetical protein